MPVSKRLVVIGGGAAGFFCAVNAARLNPNLEVIIVEKTGKLLSKVKVSGGGRCNVTHACFDIAAMSRSYPRGSNFVKKTFHQFFTTDTIEWFRERNVSLKTEEDGRMFPVTDSSQTIINCLLSEAERYGVQLKMNTEVKKLEATDTGWDIITANETIPADFVCIASGGYPKPAMFEWIKILGHTIEDPVPSLFTFNMPGHPITSLMGVSVEQARVRIQNSKLEQEAPLLITHWGLSGPAILKLSAWGARTLMEKNWKFDITVNWLPAIPEMELHSKFQSLRFEWAAKKLSSRNPFGLPQRLWEYFLAQGTINPEKRWADLSTKEQNVLVKYLSGSTFSINGKTTFKEEFVTAGGVKLSEVDPHTMMSKKQKQLYFAGEILDVDGITGGFNFQHAWTSGFIAAMAMRNE